MVVAVFRSIWFGSIVLGRPFGIFQFPLGGVDHTTVTWPTVFRENEENGKDFLDFRGVQVNLDDVAEVSAPPRQVQ